MSFKTGEIKTRWDGEVGARRVLRLRLPTGNRNGHFIYIHEGALFAIPFDPARLELRGAAVPILEDVAGDPNSGAGQFSFSGPGTFVYRTGKASTQSYPVSWLDNLGKTQPLIATPGLYLQPRFSPNGQRLALAKTAGSKEGIFGYDVRGDTVTRPTVDDQQTRNWTWSPDGKHIVFRVQSRRRLRPRLGARGRSRGDSAPAG